jgi:hypothetical protein
MASERQNGMATLTLPADLALEIEREAAKAGTSVDIYLREVLRQEHAERVRKALECAHEYVKTLPPTPYTEEDVPRLVKEARRQLWAEQHRRIK